MRQAEEAWPAPDGGSRELPLEEKRRNPQASCLAAVRPEVCAREERGEGRWERPRLIPVVRQRSPPRSRVAFLEAEPMDLRRGLESSVGSSDGIDPPAHST